jgi:hypothetical protein
MPVILKVTQNNATSDSNGVASVVPTGGGFSPPVEVDVQVTAGTSAVLDDPLLIYPPPLAGKSSSGARPPVTLRPIRGPVFRDEIRVGQR